LTEASNFPRMVPMKRILLSLALGLAALPAGAQSADEGYRTGRWEISLNPGWAVPVGATNDLMKTSMALTATGAYQFHRLGTAGLELGWQFNHHEGGMTAGQLSQDFDRDGLNDRVAFGSNIHQKILQLTPFLKFGQWMDVLSYKFRPYLLVGAGFYHTWANSGTININGTDQISGKPVGPIALTRDTASNSYFGFNSGGGFEVQVDETAALGFDLRFSRIVKTYEDLEFIVPSIRIIYLF